MILKKGNVKPSVLDRSVYRPLGGQNYKGNAWQPTVYTVEGWTLAAERLVLGLVNELTAHGVRAEGILLDVILPEGSEEATLKKLMKEISFSCSREGLSVERAQVRVSSNVKTLLMHGAACVSNKRAWCAMEASVWKKYESDMDILVLGTVGAEGAALLTREHRAQLLERYTDGFLKKAENLLSISSMKSSEAMLQKQSIAYGESMGEGGLFAALWEMSSYLKCGMEISLKSVPIKQHTIEICEYFAINPYQLYSCGAILLVCSHGEELIHQLQEEGIPAAIIGQTKKTQDKIIRYDDEIRYLEPSKMDEYHKIEK